MARNNLAWALSEGLDQPSEAIDPLEIPPGRRRTAALLDTRGMIRPARPARRGGARPGRGHRGRAQRHPPIPPRPRLPEGRPRRTTPGRPATSPARPDSPPPDRPQPAGRRRAGVAVEGDVTGLRPGAPRPHRRRVSPRTAAVAPRAGRQPGGRRGPSGRGGASTGQAMPIRGSSQRTLPSASGLVVVGALVGEQGRLARHDEAVREPRRDVELALVLARERHADPAAEGRRADADVDGDVEDLALEDRDELALGVRVLVVQPAEHAPARAREVVLDERGGQPGLGVAGAVPGLQEVAAGVAEDEGLDDQDARAFGRR